MTTIKHFIKNVSDMNSDKHNLKQGNDFMKNKIKYLFKPRLIEGNEGMNQESNTESTVNEQDDELSAEDIDAPLYPECDLTAAKYTKNEDYANFIFGLNKTNSNIVNPRNVICSFDMNKKATVTCPAPNATLNVTGCVPKTTGEKVAIERQKLALLNDKWNELMKGKKFKGKGRNVIVNGAYYYVNNDNYYYKYENSIGDSTFKPNHANFNVTCPRTPAVKESSISGFVKGKFDPTVGEECIQFTASVEDQKLYANMLESARKIRNLQAQEMEELSDTSGLSFKKNKETIKLTHQLQEYDKMVKKSKYYTDKINTLDRSRNEMLKNITMLQAQYGIIGITSIGLVYFIAKMLMKNN